MGVLDLFRAHLETKQKKIFITAIIGIAVSTFKKRKTKYSFLYNRIEENENVEGSDLSFFNYSLWSKRA